MSGHGDKRYGTRNVAQRAASRRSANVPTKIAIESLDANSRRSGEEEEEEVGYYTCTIISGTEVVVEPPANSFASNSFCNARVEEVKTDGGETSTEEGGRKEQEGGTPSSAPRGLVGGLLAISRRVTLPFSLYPDSRPWESGKLKRAEGQGGREGRRLTREREITHRVLVTGDPSLVAASAGPA